MTAGMSGYATATWGAVAAQYALLAPWLVVAAKVAAVVAVFVALAYALKWTVENLDKIADAIKSMAALFMAAGGAVTGLTSSLTGLGEAFTNNPMTSFMEKAGGALI